MTISSTVRIAGPFTGNGVTTTFPFTYKVFAVEEILVVKLNTTNSVVTTLNLTNDYTVKLNGDQNNNSGGNVTILGLPLTSDYNLVLTSNTANLQPTDLTNQGGFYPEVITNSLDRATIQIQQLSTDAARSIRTPISDDVYMFNMTLPVASQRANTVIAFDGSGLLTTTALQPSSISGNTSIVGTLNVTDATALNSTLNVTNAATIQGLTVGKGSGTIASNTSFGVNTLLANTAGANNTAIGQGALTANSTGSQNTAFGSEALSFNTNSSSATAIGFRSLKANTTGVGNTAIGWNALTSNTTGANNTAVGRSAMFINTTGINNTAIGENALFANSIGSFNTAIGNGALDSNTVGISNTAVGFNSMTLNTTGIYGSAIGFGSLESNTTGTGNTAVGYNSLQSNTIGTNNVSVGFRSLLTNATGINNTSIGTEALKVATSTNNTALGHSAGSTATTGSANIFLGASATPSSIVVSNEVNIYNGSVVARFQGAAAAWTFVSDARDKDNIENLSFGLDFIKQLQPRKFNWNIRNSDVDKGKEAAGFIAQELASVVELQSADCLGLVYTNDPNQFSIAQTNLIPVLVKAIQELNAKFEAYVATHP